jgi:hypothetical protein
MLLAMVERAQPPPERKPHPSRHLERLEACVQALRNADALLLHSYARGYLPLPASVWQAASLHRRSYTQLGESFAVLAHGLASLAANDNHNRECFEAALVNALQCWKNALLISYLTHNAPPAGLWYRVHMLYRLIEPVWTGGSPQALNTSLSRSRAHDVYRHTLLLGIASPEALPPAALLELDRALPTWAGYARLQPGGHSKPDMRWYALLPDSDSPPTRAADLDRTREGIWLYLDPSRLEQLLTSTLGNSTEASLVTHIMRSWAGRGGRLHRRRQGSSRADCRLGIGTLLGTDTATPAGSQQTHAATAQSATIINQSAGGACLLWQTQAMEGHALRLGQLVCVSDGPPPARPRQFRVGQVRWLRAVGEGAILSGVQWLAQRASSAWIYRATESNAPTTRHPAILLSPGDTADSLPGLLCPAPLTEPHMQAWITSDGRCWLAQFAGLREMGTDYVIHDLASFRYVGPDPQHQRI